MLLGLSGDLLYQRPWSKTQELVRRRLPPRRSCGEAKGADATARRVRGPLMVYHQRPLVLGVRLVCRGGR